jgi:hypothetical protein
MAPIQTGGQVVCADLKNCLHLDDITAALIPDSTQPAPAPIGLKDPSAETLRFK